MSTNKYLIALDLDGTLLTDDKVISSYTKKVLKKLEDEGNLIVICSGRAPRSIEIYHNDIGLNHSPCIGYNGAYIFNNLDSNFQTISHILNKDELIDLYKRTINKYVSSVMSENLNTIYCDEDDSLLFNFFQKMDMNIKTGEIDQILNEDVYTYIMKIKKENERTRNSIQKVIDDYFPNLRVRFWSSGDYCELYKPGVSKANALLELMKLYDINKDNVLVFGDADNDIEMINEFKHSYSMVNGTDELLKACDTITEFDNNHDGVAIELVKFFNLDI